MSHRFTFEAGSEESRRNLDQKNQDEERNQNYFFSHGNERIGGYVAAWAALTK
jgi:hypothetical protein